MTYQSTLEPCCLIVHPDPFVAQDLQDILISAGATKVDVVPALADEVRGNIRIAFVAGRVPDILSADHVRAWADGGVPVVVFDGDGTLTGPGAENAVATCGVHVLAQPFRTEDVTRLLRELAVF
ncbi:hypothetical protein GCM10023209_34570 [Roseibacterium beibuensis]|uniref:Response regulatory domain-containing protein n=1 Tax=[Roseibacterium] beibuensis TaxID=1193142 RepID=A0ABP9LPK9_9RHOB